MCHYIEPNQLFQCQTALLFLQVLIWHFIVLIRTLETSQRPLHLIAQP